MIDGQPVFPFAFSATDAGMIINFLDKHFKHMLFDNILVHCEAGVSRSQALALFIAKYYYKDENLYHTLLHDTTKIFGGNQYVYNTLKVQYQKGQ